MNKLLFALLPCIAIGCVSGSVEDDVSMHQSLQVPGVPNAPMVLETVDVFMDFDMSDFMGEMYKHSSSVDLSVTDNSFTIDGTGNFNFLKHIKISIVSKDSPETTFADADVAENTNHLFIPVLLTSDKLMNYLKESSSLKFTLTGYIPQNDFTVEYNLALHVQANVSKSIPDLVSK